ncbi:MAG: glycosyltransferase family 4 protein [Planctomycetota bacterium]
MKIVFFDFVFHFGGAPQLVADLTKRLSAEHEVQVIDVYGVCQDYIRVLRGANIATHVLLPKTKHEEAYIGYKNRMLQRLWRILRRLPSFWLLRRRVIRKIREIDPDVIWTTTNSGLLFAGTCWYLRRYALVRYVCTCLEASEITWFGRCLMKYRASVLMAISTETARQLQSAGIRNGKIEIVFDTIDIDDTLSRSKEPPEEPLPALYKHPRIVLAASLCNGKGQHTAIKAAARLKSAGLEPVLWLAGNKYGNDQSYVEYLRDLIDQLGLAENVYLLGWRSDVPSIIDQSDMVVVPSHSEGFCHAVLEGMLLRRPVIATSVGGIKDSIENGVNGLNFPVDDDESLASHIKRLATDSQLVAVLTENGYKTATETYSPENHTKRVTQALVKAVERKKKLK